MKLLLLTLIVTKIAFATPEPAIGDVIAKFNEAGIAWNAVDQVNWPQYPYKPEVKFRIMHSDTEIYLQFHVRENGVRATQDFDFGSSPFTDDCVEFFIIPSDRDSTYYNLEMNCIGHGTFDYGPGRFDRHCCGDEIIRQIRRHSTLGSKAFGTHDGEQEWTLTLAIPKRLFAQSDLNLTSFSSRTVRANFYKCGDKTATRHYLSWSPVRTEHPNFHTPEWFGALKFE